MRDVLIVLLAVPAGVLCVAVGFVVGFWSLGFFLPGDYMRALTAFWIGDVSGILAVLPFLLVALDEERRWRRRLAGATVDIAIFVLMLATSLWLVFGAGFANELRFFYLLFIPVIWIAIRRGITGAALGVLAVQACVAAAVLVREYPAETFQAFQTFFIMIDATGLLLGATVTARYQAELQLQRHQAQADHVARITTVGIMGSALAHQISQPLASIATNAHTATLLLEANAAVPRQVRTALAQIASETERAGQVLRQLRDFIAEGRIDLRRIDIAEVVHRVAALVRRQNALVPVSLAVQAPRGLPVYADAMQLEQVLLNVVNNAVEATLASGPLRTVGVAARSTEESIEITVDDEGGGIEPELASRLFEPFVTTKSHGMGLGLAICRTIVEAHGGTIGFEARPHGGTRFAIRIPRA
jgi:signal transduction histidine kinase